MCVERYARFLARRSLSPFIGGGTMTGGYSPTTSAGMWPSMVAATGRAAWNKSASQRFWAIPWSNHE